MQLQQDDESQDIFARELTSQGVDIEIEKRELQKIYSQQKYTNHARPAFLDNPAIILTIVIGLLVDAYIVLLQSSQDQMMSGFSRLFRNIFTSFIFGMSLFSYIQSSRIKNICYLKKEPPFYVQAENNQGDFNKCGKCNLWKPERAHHCSVCNTCVYRMDHHCTWTANCIGMNNHKAFFLFLFYTTISTIYFMIEVVLFIFDMYHAAVPIYSIFFYLNMFTLFILSLPLAFTLIGLLVTQCLYIINNQTTIDVLKNSSLPISCPCQTDKSNDKIVNKYDLGIMANIAEFFSYSWATFWLPLRVDLEKDGIFHKQVRIYYDIQDSHEQKQKMIEQSKENSLLELKVDEKYYLNLFEKEYAQYSETYSTSYIKFQDIKYQYNPFDKNLQQLQDFVAEQKKQKDLSAEQQMQQ